MPHPCDCLIIGAGAAGLAAAAHLVRARKSVCLLEARPRLGGRIHTRHLPGVPFPIERGAEFIHGFLPETWRIVNHARLAVYDGSDQVWAHRNRQLRPAPNWWNPIDQVMSRLPKAPNQDISYADFLKHYCRDIPPRAKRVATAYVEGFNAADRRHIGIAGLRKAQQVEDQLEGDRLFRFAHGYATLIDTLAAAVPSQSIWLNAPVQRLSWGSSGVQAHLADGRSCRASRAIITLPVGILHAGDVAFDPPLPRDKLHALAHIRMGPVVKVILVLREPFWQHAKETEDLAFAQKLDEPFPTWWTLMPMRAPTLTAWAGGTAAEPLAAMTDAQIASTARTTFTRLFNLSPVRAARLVQHIEVANWQQDPFAKGAYSYLAVEGIHAPAALAKPVANRLYFAGEATHPGMAGTVEGALASGQRAAKQLLQSQ